MVVQEVDKKRLFAIGTGWFIKGGIESIEVTGIQFILNQTQPFAKALVMDDFTFAQEFNGIPDVGIVGKAENVIISSPCFLFCSQIFVEIGDRIAFDLEIGGSKRGS